MFGENLTPVESDASRLDGICANSVSVESKERRDASGDEGSGSKLSEIDKEVAREFALFISVDCFL